MRTLLRCSALLALAAGALSAADRPNIIYLLADDVGYGDLGCYGQQQLATPALDQLAASGLRFTQHYAGNPCCAPSRSSFMTGHHTGRTRHRDNRRLVHSYGFKPEDVTVAEVMKAAGYVTGITGKWHLGDRVDSTNMAHHHGFDYAYCLGFPYPEGGREHWPSHVFIDGRRTPIPENAGGRKGRYMDDLYADAAIDFIREQRTKPFFLFVSFQGVHAPMDGTISRRYADKDWPEPEKIFASMLERLDTNIGRIIATLRELGLQERTLVLFSSDNGPHNEGGHSSEFFRSAGPWRGAKFQYYEGGIRAPLIAAWPGRIKPGMTTDHLCATWDLLPTFAALAGVAPPREIEGLSFLPTLLGEPEQQQQHDYLYWEGLENGGTQAVRWRNWKAVRRGVSSDEAAPFALYDLTVDSGEQHDRAAHEPNVLRKIAAIAAEAHRPSLETPLFAHERATAQIPPDGSFELAER